MHKIQWSIVIIFAFSVVFFGSPAVQASERSSVEETLAALGQGAILGPAKAPVTVVEENVRAGKITDDKQVEIPVFIQIDK